MRDAFFKELITEVYETNFSIAGAVRGKRMIATVPDDSVERAPDPVDRDFVASAPNRCRVADLEVVSRGEFCEFLVAGQGGCEAGEGQVTGGEVRLVRAQLSRPAPTRPAAGTDAGRLRTKAFRAWLSWVFAPDTATVGGMSWASDSMCSLLPFLPRSTGFGPVSAPLFSPARLRRP